jgi:DNA-binding NarL/FixJ family response regulator
VTEETRSNVREGIRKQIRVMLVDDHDSFRQPLVYMLEREPDLTVTAQAGSLAEAREGLRKAFEEGSGVDVAVVDLDLPDGSGTNFIAELFENTPDAQALVLSAFSEPGRIAQAIEAGAAGVVNKSSPIGDILSAIRRLSSGEQLLSKREVIEAVRYMSRRRQEDRESQLTIGKLTPKEREVLQALADGLSDKEIAKRLYVGIGTVRSHMTSILTKFGTQSRLQALLFAARHGLVRID